MIEGFDAKGAKISANRFFLKDTKEDERQIEKENFFTLEELEKEIDLNFL